MSQYNDALKDLQRQFVRKLPERLALMRVAYQSTSACDWQPECAQKLHYQLHSLTGSAGTFGMQSLGVASRQLETRLKGIVESGVVPLPETWDAIGAELSHMESLALSGSDTPAPHVSPHAALSRLVRNPLIYLLEDDPGQAEQLSSTLKDNGFRVQLFTSLEDFRATWQQGARPDALVLDMVFPEGEAAGVELLKELNTADQSFPPVVMTTVRDDQSARLAAYRAGASHYLSKPLEAGRLCDILDNLTDRVPESPYRVMLVDDDPLLLEAQSAVLQQAGMVVTAISEPSDTLQLLDSFKPDVLVLDVYMPDIRGPELAAIVRERHAYLQLPILFLSAETDMGQQLQALNLGGDDFLVKPVQPQHLVSAIIARARRARQNQALSQRLQQALYEREREHQALDLHAIVSMADMAGRITYANDLFCQISGYQRDELLGQNHRIVKSTEHCAQFYEDLWQTISNGQVWHGEICNRRKGGGLYWVVSTITPLVDDRGKPYQYISVRTDITRQKLAEQAERKQNAISAVLAEAANLLLSSDYQQLDVTITQVLGLAGVCLAVERAYLFELSHDGWSMCNSHEWCAPGIASQQQELQNLPITMAPWWWQQILQGKPVLVPDIKELPVDAAADRKLFESLDIRALCGFPLQRHGQSVGFIGFDQLDKARDWEHEYLDSLLMLANLINSALARGRSEQIIQEQQRFSRAILDSVSAHIAVLDKNGLILAVNESWKSYGASNAVQPGEPVANSGIGTNYLQVCCQAREAGYPGVDRVVDGIKEVLSGNSGCFRSEYPCHSEDEQRWFEMIVMPLLGSDGGVVVSHNNISERKLAEESKERSVIRLNATLESTKDGILAVDNKGEILFMNQQFREMWNLPGHLADSASDEQLLSHALSQLAEPEAFLSKVKALYMSDDESEDLIELADGRVFERHSKPLKDINNIHGRVWSFHDITERLRAEQGADAAKERLRRGQLFANIGTWEWDIVTGDLFWTERIAPLFGYPDGDLETSYENFLAAVHPDDRQAVNDAVTACIDRDVPYDIEHRVVWPDGSVHWLLERGDVQRDSEGNPMRMIGVVQDINDRKLSEFALEDARDAADLANRAKSEFLSSMSHELRTPMNAILGFGQLMEYDDTLPEEHRDNVYEILKAGGHLLELINEVLDLAKVESGTINLSLEPVAVCPVIQECHALVAALAEKRHIHCSLECADDTMVRADRIRLKQVLLNLLSNAIKYNREAGSVKLEVQYPGINRLRILVRDTGPGIAADQLDGLFQPFNRLGAEGSNIEGTGIGLTITQRIVEMMGGTIGVESELGVGSCFWIELPMEQPLSNADSRHIAELEKNSKACCGEDCQAYTHNVLYIEDNPANLKLVTQILGTVPHLHLFTAHTPALGIELALARQPDLILLDINMPGMDGYEVIKVLHHEPDLQHTPVIAITANAMPSDIKRGKDAGFNDYITKPINIDHFLASVQQHLNNKK
ncbi:response regulator [Nitrincola alkalilacustris]|uniref:response regulator n=1 Tax=Nitrincola alkalilacustris TaxID=1571224 RepID=UPI00124CD27C|nr:response regulator [Nitrincola alkalilacustris]